MSTFQGQQTGREPHDSWCMRERWCQWPGPEDMEGDCTDVAPERKKDLREGGKK